MVCFSEEFTDYSQENNQNHTNLPPSLTVNIVPPKQESVIISTEEARNMLHFEEIKSKYNVEEIFSDTRNFHLVFKHSDSV